MKNVEHEVSVAWSNSMEVWMVIRDSSVSSKHRLKQTAEKNGRKVAKQLKPSKFVVKRKDGGVSYQQLYGV